MTFAALRKQLTTALDGARIRYALRFPNQKSGVLVIDLDPAPANLASARGALGKWPDFVAWLAAESPAPQCATPTVMMTTQLAPAPAGGGPGDEAALMAAIIAAPDDDAARLVYADLLIARSDPHGELIVLQCRQAAGDRSKQVSDRIAALLETGWKAYAGEIAPYADHRAFQRGFVHQARMTVAAFARHGKRIFGELPTHTLALANEKLTAADIEKLARVLALELVRGLHIAHSWDSTERVPLAPLAKAKLHHVRELELYGAGHSVADWTSLLGSIKAHSLTSIRLHRNYTSAAIQTAIATNPALAGVRHLNESVQGSLDTKPLTCDAYELLAINRSLASLSIESNVLVDDNALAPMFAPDTKAALRNLNLAGTAMTDRLLHTIAESPKATLLEYVDLSGSITLDGVRTLLDAAVNLRSLAVQTLEWDREAVSKLEALLLAVPADRPLKTVAMPRSYESPALSARFRVDAS